MFGFFKKPKLVKLRSLDNNQKYGIAAASMKELLKKGCKTLQLRPAGCRVCLYEDGTEVTEDYFRNLHDNTELILLTKGQEWNGDVCDVSHLLATSNTHTDLLIESAKSLLSDENAPKRRKIIHNLSDDAEAENREDDEDWFEGMNSRFKTKSAYMKYNGESRVRGYLKEVEDYTGSIKSLKVQGEYQKIVATMVKQLKTVKYNGCYFDRREKGDNRLCTPEGWFSYIWDVSLLLGASSTHTDLLIESAKSLLSDENAPKRRKILQELIHNLSDNAEAENREDDKDWFEGINSRFKTKSAYMKYNGESRVRGYLKEVEDYTGSIKSPKVQGEYQKIVATMVKQLKTVKYNGCYFDRREKGDNRLCTPEGWFSCQGAFDADKCPSLHSINPYGNRESRILFSTWNLDHRIEKKRTIIPALAKAVQNQNGREINWEYFYSLLFTRENLKLVHIACHKKTFHNLEFKTKSAYMKYNGESRVRGYLKEVEDYTGSIKSPKVQGEYQKIVATMVKQLKTVKYNGCYFDRREKGDNRLCTPEGWFSCQGAFDADKCPSLHSINPYGNRESRILFSTWNLDHRIEKKRTIIPALAKAVQNQNGREINWEYFYSLLFTRENLKLVHIACHKKTFHNLECDGSKVYSKRKRC
ncbi:DFFB factor, partial [Polyodon spathula]|nr:DFFB factor [Polyodon spathula]